MPVGSHSGKFNPTTLNKLYSGLKTGLTYEHAAKYAGISEETLRQWRNNKFPDYVTQEEKDAFFEEFELAEGEGAMTKMLIISQHSKDDWKAAAWQLERRYPDSYGRVIQRVEHSNEPGKAFEISVTSPKIEALLGSLSADQLIALRGITQQIREGDIIDAEVRELDPVAIEANHGDSDT